MTQLRLSTSESAFRQTCEKLADRGGNVLVSCLSIKLLKVLTGSRKNIKAEAIEPALRKIARDRGLETLRNGELLKKALAEELGVPEILEDEVFNEKFSESFELAISSFMNGFVNAVSNKIFRVLEFSGRRVGLASVSSAVRSVIGNGGMDIINNTEEFRARICDALNITIHTPKVQTAIISVVPDDDNKEEDPEDEDDENVVSYGKIGLSRMKMMFNKIYEMASRSNSGDFIRNFAFSYWSMLQEIGIDASLQGVIDNIKKLADEYPEILKEKEHLRRGLFVMYDLYGKVN